MADKLGEFLTAHDWKLLETLKGWKVSRDSDNPAVIRLELSARDGEKYIVRFVCDGYPVKAPSVKFINAQGQESDKTAWPAGNAEFYEVVKLPPNSFLCTDLTREGFQHHGDWVGRPTAWSGNKHTLMVVFNYLHDLLHSNNYQQRAK